MHQLAAPWESIDLKPKVRCWAWADTLATQSAIVATMNQGHRRMIGSLLLLAAWPSTERMIVLKRPSISPPEISMILFNGKGQLPGRYDYSIVESMVLLPRVAPVIVARA
jgi:hypothetical protein